MEAIMSSWRGLLRGFAFLICATKRTSQSWTFPAMGGASVRSRTDQRSCVTCHGRSAMGSGDRLGGVVSCGDVTRRRCDDFTLCSDGSEGGGGDVTGGKSACRRAESVQDLVK